MRRRSTCKSPGDQRGFSYLEVMVATLLIAITLVPALEALQSGIQGSGIHQERSEDNYRLTAKLEEVLAQPFSLLQSEADAVASSAISVDLYSDDAGTPHRHLVYLARYDGDDTDGDKNPFTGIDDNLLWVKAVIEGGNQEIETLVSRY